METNIRWKYIDSSKRRYFISNTGRIIAYKKDRNGSIVTSTAKDIIPYKSKGDFYCITIKGRAYKLHYLIAYLFLPNPNNFHIVTHIDGDRGNNIIDNLKWIQTLSFNKNLHNIPNFSFSTDSLCGETWKVIEGSNNKYYISSLGRVKSLYSYPKILAPKINSDGYAAISVIIDNKRVDTLVHILSAKTFLNYCSGLEVDHINGNRLDNSITNLRVVSHTDNINNPYTIEKFKKRKGPMRGRLGKDNPLSKPIFAIDNNGNKLFFEGIWDADRKGYAYHRVRYSLTHPNKPYKNLNWFYLK